MTREQQMMKEITDVALKLSGGDDNLFDLIFKNICEDLGIELIEMPLEKVDGNPVATTAIGNLKAELY